MTVTGYLQHFLEKELDEKRIEGKIFLQQLKWKLLTGTFSICLLAAVAVASALFLIQGAYLLLLTVPGMSPSLGSLLTGFLGVALVSGAFVISIRKDNRNQIEYLKSLEA